LLIPRQGFVTLEFHLVTLKKKQINITFQDLNIPLEFSRKKGLFWEKIFWFLSRICG